MITILKNEIHKINKKINNICLNDIQANHLRAIMGLMVINIIVYFVLCYLAFDFIPIYKFFHNSASRLTMLILEVIGYAFSYLVLYE